MEQRLTKEQFVVEAILKLRDPSRSQGIHSVYSGFNQAFKQYFGEDARPTTEKMAAEGKIVVRPVRGGVMLYLPEDAPKMESAGERALKQMGL